MPTLPQQLLGERVLSGSQLAEVLRQLHADTIPLPEDGPLGDLFEYHAEPLRQVDRYELIREVGQGGTAVVYEAIDTRLNQHVALKVLHASAQPDALSRLKREARLAARLVHPQVIPVREIGEAPGPGGRRLHYIVMDYIAGRTLKDEGAPAFSRDEKIDLWSQVVAVVAFAHSEGVIHRDLKPDNVLVTAQQRAVVTDFGLARGADSSQLTHSGVLMGTVYYMSPEQVLGQFKECDARTDVWALGVMLYEILAQQRPFEGATYAVILDAIVQHDPPPPPGPAALGQICMVALSKQPDARYADAGQMLADLEAWVSGVVRPGPGPAPRRQPSLRVPLLTLLVGLGAWLCVNAWMRTAAPAGGSAVGRQARPSQAPTKLATEQSRRSLVQRVSTLVRAVGELRAAHYHPKADIPARRLEVRAALAELNRVDPAVLASQWVNSSIARGHAWFWLHDLQQAEKILLAAEAVAPRNGWVRLYLGRIWLEQILSRRIKYRAERASSARLDKASVRKALAYLSRDTDRWLGAKPIDRAVLQALVLFLRGSSAKLEAHCGQAEIRLRGQPGLEEIIAIRAWHRGGEAAIRLYGKALALRPHNALVRLWRGFAYKQMGQYERAIADCTAALELRPRLAQALFTRATCLSRINRRDAALEDYDRLLSVAPADLHALHNRALIKFELGRKTGAIEDLGRVIRSAPGSWRSLGERARIHLSLGQLAHALADANRAIRVAPRQGVGYYYRGRVRGRQGRYADAIDSLDKALQLEPRRWEYLLSRGVAYSALGKPLRAIRDYSAVLRLNQKSLHAYLNRARQRHRLGRCAQALADLDIAIRLDPDCAEAWELRGQCRVELRQAKQAIRDYRRALELAPRKARVHQQLAVALILDNEAMSALANLNRAIALDPRLPHAHGNRAQILWSLGRTAEAAADLEVATRLDPRNWENWKRYGAVLLDLKRSRQARAALLRARELAPASAKGVIDALLKSSRGG